MKEMRSIHGTRRPEYLADILVCSRRRENVACGILKTAWALMQATQRALVQLPATPPNLELQRVSGSVYRFN